MITFFRRLINSKVGIVVALALLVVIAIGFAATDIRQLGGGGAVASGSVAKVGGTQVSTKDLSGRVDQQMREARQRQPGIDIAGFVASGGVESTLDRLLNGMALQVFGERNGVRASDRLIDGQIASIPGFQGLSGKFDEKTFRAALAQQRVTEAELRADIANGAISTQLIGPIAGATQVPAEIAKVYAQLLLERRAGEIGIIPAASLPAGPAPTAQEVQTYYQRNIARFTIPERRVLRYASFDASRVADKAKPTDAEIAQAYAANRQRYAARETRDLSQVIVLDQATANSIRQRVAGGASVADAARAAGLEASAVTGSDKAGFAAQSSAAVADAAFAAAEGAVVGPVRSPLGWHVVQVRKVTQIPAKSLADARAELTKELTATKQQEALTDLVASIEEEASAGASVSEVAQKFGLQLTTTKPLLPNGADPDAPAAPPAEVAAVLAPAFEADLSDDPQVSALGQSGRYLLWDIESVVAPTPRPLASVREVAVQAIVRDRQLREARRLARQVSAAVGKGQSLQAALNAAKVSGGRVQAVSGTRAQLSGNGERPSPALALMFSMAKGTARYIEAPNDAGFLVVKVDEIVPGDASKAPQVVAATRGGLSRVVGQEYAQQFVNAVRDQVGVTIDRGAVEGLKRELTGQTAQ